MNLLNFRGNVLGLICLAITVGIFMAGLWPFNLFPENKVRWLKDQNGIEFYGQSLIFSTIPFFQSSTIPEKSLPSFIFLFLTCDSQPVTIFFLSNPLAYRMRFGYIGFEESNRERPP
jgi:hypothetical protein